MSAIVGTVDIQEEWKKWKLKHSKSYETEEEERKRFQIFEKNLKEILHHNEKFNAGEVTFSKGLNAFTDLNSHEIPKGLLRKK